jgi:hypothetical protein
MWPWEHLLFGYLVFSLSLRVVGPWLGGGPTKAAGTEGGPITASSVGILLFWTQFPDLIDKPLAWQFGVLESGTSVAHSVFVAVPVSMLALPVAVHWGRPVWGIAVAVGYLTHLAGDVLFPALVDGTLSFQPVLWPLAPTEPTYAPGLLVQVQKFALQFADFLTTPRGVFYLLIELVLVAGGVLLWRADGYPGLGFTRRSVAGLRSGNE